ncbi:lysophospholipase L1-like esterase [Lentzea atacamensis]|uniref:Lysophospholipase L1-like esterase n=1 Tax=Lentzea atacamensis TaxID=531938 RepID=A0A316I3U1_9PSEU|nr:SGNH/GDSL hydrolase family protein [Lentzea atacamensis]PWK87050.1 lysophospholipase L1-like esterase [Lentzea atacamensis]
MSAKVGLASLVLALVVGGSSALEASRHAPEWIGSWQAAPASAQAGTDTGHPNKTIRNVVHTSIGGKAARVRLSNAFGTAPVLMGHVTVALSTGDAGIVPLTMREVTFGGVPSVTIPPGAEVVSDAVTLTVPPDADLAVTVYTPSESGPATYHPQAYRSNYFATGDHASDETGTLFAAATTSFHYVSGVEVRSSQARGAVVAFGDSITDGAWSTRGANLRWPDQLFDRLMKRPAALRSGVLNAGISANRLASQGTSATAGPNGLARLDRDALTRAGVRTIVLMEGINDIQNSVPAAQLIMALRQVVERSHAAGVRVVAGTIAPWKGWRTYTPERESIRLEVNSFIRTAGIFDGVVDFDSALRDPSDPEVLRPSFDSGDHLHPNDAGYRAMAEAVDLRRL